MSAPVWRNRIVSYDTKPANQFAPNPLNWRTHPNVQREALRGLLGDVGWVGAVLENKQTGNLVDGHARIEEALSEDSTQLIPYLLVDLTPEEEKLVLASFDPISALATADSKRLEELLKDVSSSSQAVDSMLAELAKEHGVFTADEPKDATIEPEKAAECQQKWQVVEGEIIQIGAHLLMCGDSTNPATFSALMRNEKAVLCHADPPYGMGKENDGVANDNLYREKLDAFQMAWWKAVRPSLEDNASAYIWGNDEDLWRLWYRGGLNESERLTLRNLIIWNKPPSGLGDGQNNSIMRSYGIKHESCLFFMLGEQGFNNNADNYWEGWDSVVNYLKAEKFKTGWDIAKFKRLAGHSETSGCHWFDKSQWSFPTKGVYQTWQSAAKGKAFTRSYDDLKAEFYATRAYFDNTHDNMTDVWDFARVEGEERWGHSTPKPAAMVQRIIKSSALEGAIVVDPMTGSGPTLVACENLNRKARAVELKPEYCALICERMTTAFPHLKIEKVDQARAA